MNLIQLLRNLIPDSTLRAYVLKGLRYLAALAAGAMIPVLTKWGMNATDATAIATAIGTLIVTAGGAVAGTILDFNSVDKQITAAHALGASTAASAIASGKTTPDAIAALSGSPAALKSLLTNLEAGTAK